MVFWIITALLTAAASIAVMYPFLRQQKAAAEAEHDLAVYKDQLSELESEVKRGLIPKDDAAEARAEIGRRIIKLNDATKPSGESRQLAGKSRLVAVAGILAVPIISWGLYGYLGSPGMPAMPLAGRLHSDPAMASIGELIGRAESHLANNPQDIKGWETLAPVYMRLGRYRDAAKAYRQIILLSGSKAGTEAMLGEALVGVSEGIVTSDAVAAFRKALELDPKEPRAQFFIALARAQEGKLEEARNLWSQMVSELPQNSPWHAVAQEALSGHDSNGSSAETSDARPEVDNSGAQQDMIEGMVASLDARLRENPDNPEGWQQLVRSYIVLGRQDDARDALKRGMEALGNESAAAEELSIFSRDLGISLPEDEL